MVNAAGILSIRAEDTDLDESVKKRVCINILKLSNSLQIFLKYFALQAIKFKLELFDQNHTF